MKDEEPRVCENEFKGVLFKEEVEKEDNKSLEIFYTAVATCHTKSEISEKDVFAQSGIFTEIDGLEDELRCALGYTQKNYFEKITFRKALFVQNVSLKKIPKVKSVEKALAKKALLENELSKKELAKIESAKKALDLLVADIDFFCKDIDRFYRTSHINALYNKSQKEDDRDRYTEASKQIVIDKTIDILRNQPTIYELNKKQNRIRKKNLEAYFEVVEDLLKRIRDSQGSEKREGKSVGVYGWLYQDKHFGMISQNKKKYKKSYLSYYNFTKEKWPPTKQELENFIKERRNINKITLDDILPSSYQQVLKQKRTLSKMAKCKANAYLLNYLECEKSVKDVLQDVSEYSEKSTGFHRIFIENYMPIFITEYLPQFIYQELSYYYQYPDGIQRIDDRRRVKEYKVLQKRYQKIQNLRREYEQINVGELEGFLDGFWWEVEGKKDTEKENKEIEDTEIEDTEKENKEIKDSLKAILAYIQNVHGYDNIENVDVIKRRIIWVMKCSEELSTKVIYLLAMTISCKKNIVRDRGVQFRGEIGKNKMSNERKDKLRYEEIKLLQSLHEAFGISESEQNQNWNTYLAWQGKEIRSKDEYDFWKGLLEEKTLKIEKNWNCKHIEKRSLSRKSFEFSNLRYKKVKIDILKRKKVKGKSSWCNYEKVPAIGFQLCFIDYCESCLPVHMEGLSFVAGLKGHRDQNYYKFYKKNKEEIHMIAEKIESPELNLQAYPKYIEAWKDSKTPSEDTMEILKCMYPKYAQEKLFKLAIKEGIGNKRLKKINQLKRIKRSKKNKRLKRIELSKKNKRLKRIELSKKNKRLTEIKLSKEINRLKKIDESYPCLLMETIIQIHNIHQAKNRLYNIFEKLYGISIDTIMNNLLN